MNPITTKEIFHFSSLTLMFLSVQGKIPSLIYDEIFRKL